MLTESVVEDAALAWFEELNYSVLYGPDIAPGEPTAKRASYADVVLVDRLRSALGKINPTIPSDAREEAVRKITLSETPSLFENNRRFHTLLTDGVDVEYHADDGRAVHDKVWLIDFAKPAKNDWLIVNQFTVIDNAGVKHPSPSNRRPDVVVFVNGLPLGVIELKNPADENTTIKGAFNQLQTYKNDIPGLFPYNEILVISDGLEARAGTLTADWERFMPWRTIEGDQGSKSK